MFKPIINLGNIRQVKQLTTKLNAFPDADDWDIRRLLDIYKRANNIKTICDYDLDVELRVLCEIIEATIF